MTWLLVIGLIWVVVAVVVAFPVAHFLRRAGELQPHAGFPGYRRAEWIGRPDGPRPGAAGAPLPPGDGDHPQSRSAA